MATTAEKTPVSAVLVNVSVVDVAGSRDAHLVARADL